MERKQNALRYCSRYFLFNMNIQNSPATPPGSEKTLKRLRLIAILEGISFLALLFVAMPVKYLAGNPQPVQVIGMLHGWLFVLYSLLLALAHFQCQWKPGKTLLAFLLSFIPFGTFYAEKKMFRH
jgi:integral membrane protein